MSQFSYPRTCRLTASADYERVYAQRQRFSDARILMFAAPGTTPLTRAGFSVSRKHGSAVIRHRLKRLLREAFRLVRSELPPGLDLVVIPQQGASATMEDYQGSLTRLAHKAARRLLARQDQVRSGQASTGALPRAAGDGA